ncbi:putative methyltransferase [Tanacetum coccineum]
MAGLFDKQAEAYLDAQPTYPAEWYSMFADRTSSHSLAWDVGTGNGQAAIGVPCTLAFLHVAEYYKQVIGTDISEHQLKLAKPHPRVQYFHTPLSLSDDDLIDLICGESSVDLVTVAEAVHWFDLPRFYSVINRVLKQNGVFAVWGYNDFDITPEIDAALKRFYETTLPYWNKDIKYLYDGYQTFPFPFESFGLGSEGNP